MSTPTSPQPFPILWKVLLLTWLVCVPAGAQGHADGRDEDGLRPQAIRVLAFDPLDPDILYAGTAGWGVQVSRNGGRSWLSTSDELAGAKIEALAFDGRRLWIATRERGLFIGRRPDLRRFVPVNRGLEGAHVTSLAVSVSSRLKVFFAGTQRSGLLRSLEGRSWSLVGTFLPDGVGALDVDPENGRILHAEAGEVYRSEDQGETWRPASGGLALQRRAHRLGLRSRMSAADLARICRAAIPRFVRHPEEPEEIWLGRCDGLARSEDGGKTWRTVDNVPLVPIFDVAVDPLHRSRVVLATLDGLIETRSDGDEWQLVRRAPAGVAISAVTFASDGSLVAGTTAGELILVRLDGRVQTRRLRQQQATYRPTEEDIEGWRREQTTAPYELAALAARPAARPTIRPGIDVHVSALVSHPDIPEMVWAGTRVGVFQSLDGGATWTPRSIGLGELEISDLEIDASGANSAGDEGRVTLWAATRGAGIYRSPSSGAAWLPSSVGLGDGVVRDLLQAPEDPLELWAATADAGVFHSRDGGRTWRAASDGLDEPGVRTLAFAAGRLYAGTDAGGVYASDNRAAVWERVGTLGRPPGDDEDDLSTFRRLGVEPEALHVRDLLGDPDDDNTLLAATIFGVFRSTDGGRNWDWLNLRLGVHGLHRHPYDDDQIFATTTRGLWGSRDGGDSWRLVPFADPGEPFTRRAGGPAHALPPLYAFVVDRQGDALVGTDRGEVLRAADTLADWRRVPLLEPREVKLADAAFASREGAPGDAEALRPRRDATLVAAAFDGTLWRDPHRPRRRDLLLAFEALRRQQIPPWPPEKVEQLDAVVRRLLLRDDVATAAARRANAAIRDGQEALADGWGVTSLRFDPSGRLLATSAVTDDGRRTLSEIRVYDLEERFLLSPDLMRRLGPTPHWKVLHDLARKPAVARPGWVLDGTGSILRWDRSELLLTRPADDRLALWTLAPRAGGVGTQPQAVTPRTIGGFPARPETATLSPDLRWLAATDLDGAAWIRDLNSQRPLERVYFDVEEMPRPVPEGEDEAGAEDEAGTAEPPPPTPIHAAYASYPDLVLFSPEGVVAHRLGPEGVIYEDVAAREPVGDEAASSEEGAEPQSLRRRLHGRNAGFDDLVVDPRGRWVVGVPRAGRRAGAAASDVVLVTFRGGVARSAHVLDSGRAAAWRVTVSAGRRYLAVSRKDEGRFADTGTRVFELGDELASEGPSLVLSHLPMENVRFAADESHVAFRGDDGEEIWALGVAGRKETDLVPPSFEDLVAGLAEDDPKAVADWFFEDADAATVGGVGLPAGWNVFDRRSWDAKGSRRVPRAASPDGRWLAAAGPGRLLQLWHFGAESLGYLQPPTGTTILDLRRFRPYPSIHATPTDVWPLAGAPPPVSGGTRSILGTVCAVAVRNLTVGEWEHYFGEEPYEKICAVD